MYDFAKIYREYINLLTRGVTIVVSRETWK